MSLEELMIVVVIAFGSSLGIPVEMLVATIAAGPKLAEVSAHTLSSVDLAGAFDNAFLFCMVLEIIGIVLMLAVAEKEPSGDVSGEVGIGF